MIRLLMCFALMIAATATQAQTQIPVRGGDHDGFTRLVLNLNQPQDWSMVETPSGYQIELPNWRAGFNLSQTFAKIARDRVNAVAATQNTLSFDLACECTATATQLTDGVIVVDVSPSGTVPSDTLETPPPPPEPITLPSFTARATKTITPQPAPAEVPAPQLQGFRESLLKGLKRSADLSLIELNTPPQEPVLQAQAGTSQANQQIKVIDAFERSASPSKLPDAQPDSAQPLPACPAPETFDIGTWGVPDGFTDQLAEMRRNIPTEFDRFDPAYVGQLVQLYLYFGLGTEARMILRSFDVEPTDARRFEVLAHIVEPDGRGPDGPLFEDMAHCSGTLTPWLVLAAPKTARLTEATLQDLTTTFSTWPQHLRSLLGPPLIAILTKRGFDTPASVLASLAVISQEADTPVPLNDAAFQNMPLAQLRDIIDAGGDDTPQALRTYLLRAAQDNAPLDPVYIELSEAYERETVGLAISDELNRARIKAFGHIGQTMAAKALLQDRLAKGLPDTEALFETLLDQALSRGDPLEVAGLAIFGTRIDAISNLPGDTILNLSELTLNAGLPELSAQIIEALENPPTPALAKVEAARLNPAAAIEMLQAKAETQADALRVQLLLKAGRADQVWAQDRDQLQPDQKPDVAWAAKEWAEVHTDTVRGQLATMLGAENTADVADKPIAQATALEASSAKARALISELLSSPPS